MTQSQSRRDLFQAHRLMTQRAALALLRGEPDLPDQPMRRLNVATFASVLTAVILSALFAILTLLGHGGAPPSFGQGSLIIDSQTGTPYVFCENKTKTICPVVNYASARLALKASNPDQQTVSQSALTGYSRGPLIGIPGLPQPLPNATLLVRQPWSVCGRYEVTGSGLRPVTALAGGISAGGQPLGHGALLLLAGAQYWVVWNGQRMFLPPVNLTPMNAPAKPVRVSAAFLNAIPQGPSLEAPKVRHQNQQVPRGPDGPTAVGKVFKVNGVGTSSQYYVMLSDGLAHLSQTQAALLMFQQHAPASAISLAQVSGHVSHTVLSAKGLPGHVPHFAQIASSSTVCTVYSLSGQGGHTSVQVTLGGRMPTGGLPGPSATAPPSGPPATGTSSGGAAGSGAPVVGVSRIVLPPGSGALVGAAPGSATDQGSATSYFLVSGGHRYGLSSKGVALMLGYQIKAQSVLLPPSVLGLIPLGPSLDPAAARHQVTTGG